MNRREFVLSGGGALATGGSWAAMAPGPLEAQVAAAADGSLAYWRGRVSERFDVFGAAPPVQLVLQRVDERAGGPQTSQFSLLFQASGTLPMTGAQVLRPAVGGALALYLDHGGADAIGASLLRADFCQLA